MTGAVVFLLLAAACFPHIGSHLEAGINADAQGILVLAMSEFKKATELAPNLLRKLSRICLNSRDCNKIFSPAQQTAKLDSRLECSQQVWQISAGSHPRTVSH
jgi:hypothetical protein